MSYGIFETFGSVMDLLGLSLGVVVLSLTGYIAFRQIRIMNKQTEMMKAQNEASERMEAITKRQGEIAEAQHKISEELRQRQARFLLFIWGQNHVPGVAQSVQLGIENRGTKGADGLQWTLSIPKDAKNVHFVDSTGTRVTGKVTQAADGQSYFTVGRYRDTKIFPQTSEKLVTISIPADMKELRFLWRVACDDGVSPVDARGYGESKFIQMPDGRFTLSHPIQYGDISPVDNSNPILENPNE